MMNGKTRPSHAAYVTSEKWFHAFGEFGLLFFNFGPLASQRQYLRVIKSSETNVPSLK